ncbi:PDZ domain-containing protein [Winogradskyella maritima]|nr:PDZ domain-containing protein [Winogradskyella maritima]
MEEGYGRSRSGLKEGDVIKQIDDIKIRKFADLTGYLSSKRPSDTVQVTINRNEELLTVPVVLKKRQVITVPNMGLEIKNLSKEDMKKFRTRKGVKVVGVPEIYRGYGLDGKFFSL